jgi:hypothetical protein
MPAAQNALQALIEMKTRLMSQTEEVADAIQSLEILVDFQAEFEERIAGLGKMRQGLLELMLLETTIGKVTHALEPMMQLGNIRRLGDSEIREAARVILEHRNTRISQKHDEKHLKVEAKPADAVVPTPIDAE